MALGNCFHEYIDIPAFLKILDSLPDIIEKIAFALLTILIPLAIAILSNILRYEKDKEFAVLDLHVSLDHVFKLKELLFYIILIFAPLLFWSYSQWTGKLIISFLCLIGIASLVRTIRAIYNWTKGNAQNFRVSYLKALTFIRKVEDTKAVWRSVWAAKELDSENERIFFEIFSSKAEEIFRKNGKGKSISTVSSLLEIFVLFAERRTWYFLVAEEVFPKILEWYYTVWAHEKFLREEYGIFNERTLGTENKRLIPENKVNEWRHYYHIVGILDSFIDEVKKRALKERGGSYRFFNHFKQHVLNFTYEDYLYYLSRTICRDLFEFIYDSPDRLVIWSQYFPSDWKCTKKNLEKKDNFMAHLLLNEVFEWAAIRSSRATEEYDQPLDDTIRNFFPEVDPMTWATLLIFLFSPYDYPENRMHSVIQRPWSFGNLGGRALCKTWYLKDTFELLFLMFGKEEQFSEKNLRRFISDLEKLKFESDSKEERKRVRLLNLFTQILDFRNGSALSLDQT